MIRLLPLLFLLTSGCSRSIGDGCSTNVECSPLGDRFCDIGSPGGYCTIESCDHNSCPREAVCVRFFTLPRGEEFRCGPPTGKGCNPSERCVRDTDTASYCALETTERRWCMMRCDDDGGCREGYRCLPTGQNGAEPVPYRDERGNLMDESRVERFCAPTPR